MIIGLVVLVVLLVGGVGLAVAMRSKGSSTGFLDPEVAPARPKVEPERATSATVPKAAAPAAAAPAKAVESPVATPIADVAPEPEAAAPDLPDVPGPAADVSTDVSAEVAEPADDEPVMIDLPVVDDEDDRDDRDDRAAADTPAAVEPGNVVDESGAPEAPIEPIEPMIKARITATPTIVPAKPSAAGGDDEDDGDAVLSRFKSAADRPKPHLASTAVAPRAESTPRPELAPEISPEITPETSPEPVAPVAEVVEPEPEPEPAPEPEPQLDVVSEPASAAEPVAEIEIIDLDQAVAGETSEAETSEDETSAAEASDVGTPGPGVAAADEVVVAEVIDATESIEADAPAADETAVPAAAAARMQPEPEDDPVDHVLKALISRAKTKQVGIAEVAAELVEQANLEDRDIDEVLADLVDRVDEEENVAAGDRLEELTLFNDSVPRRPGQLTDFDRLDKGTKKRVIIRVLCLLVAMQEDNRLTPSEPRSEAETRHWPLSRAVWPIPAADGAAGDAPPAADDPKKQLPDRNLIRTKR